MRLVPAGGSPPQANSTALSWPAGPQPERDNLETLLSKPCTLHGLECEQIECRLIEPETRRRAGAPNWREAERLADNYRRETAEIRRANRHPLTRQMVRDMLDVVSDDPEAVLWTMQQAEEAGLAWWSARKGEWQWAY